MNVSTSRKALLMATGVLVIVPTLLAACFGSLVAAARIYEFIFIQGPTLTYGIGTHLMLFAITVLGWVGLITQVRLHSHFLRSYAAPDWHRFAWTGLLCGVIACISLMIWINASLLLRVVLLGWPLIAAVVMAWLLTSAEEHQVT